VYSVAVTKAYRKRAKSARGVTTLGDRHPADAAKGNVVTPAVLASAVALVALAAHWPALSAQALSFDDNQYLTENPLVQRPSWASAGRFLGEVLAPSTVRGYYQPLAMISLMLDAAMGGRPENLRPFHRTSLALHTANTALVVVLMHALFGHAWAAAMTGLLFGVHPLTVEPIPWVGERKTLLTTFFALCCLVSYVRYARVGGGRWYGCSIVAYVLALLSKPTSTPLPVVLLIVDYWPLRRLGRRALVEKIAFFVVAGVSAAITTISQARTATVATPRGYDPTIIPLTLCHNVVFYLYKMVWPSHLSAHYPYPQPFTIGQPMVLVGVIGTALLIPLLLLSLRWTRALAVGWAGFFVAIFPPMGVIGFTHSIASDKYAYLPSIGLLLPLCHFLGKAWDALGRRSSSTVGQGVMLGIVGVVAVAEIIATRRTLANWQDTEGHFRHMLALTPHARILHHGLADALRTKAFAHQAGALLNEAAEHYRLATRPGPDSPFGRNDILTCAALNNLGNILAGANNVDAALACWNEVLRLNPKDYNAHNNVGIALAWQGRTDAAIAHYAEALRLRSDLPETHNNLGIELAKKGRIDEAITHYRESIRLNPNFAMAYRNLAAALSAAGKVEPAIDVYRRLVVVRPLDADAHYQLGLLLEQYGRTQEAGRSFQQVLRIDPQHADARRRLERLLAQ